MAFYRGKRKLSLRIADDAMFRCERQHAVLSRVRCARMYEKANGAINPRSPKRTQIEEGASNPGCRGCGIGYAHLLGDDTLAPAAQRPILRPCA